RRCAPWRPTMGASQRRKGLAAEREFARLIGGKRVPLSGAQEGWRGGVGGMGLTFEVKRRADGWRELYRWLDHADAVALRADRAPWLVVIPLETFRRMVQGGGER